MLQQPCKRATAPSPGTTAPTSILPLPRLEIPPILPCLSSLARPSFMDMEQLARGTMAPEEGYEDVGGHPTEALGDNNHLDQPHALDGPGLEKESNEHLEHLKPNPKSSSLLENLPAELRDQILLSAPDLRTLQTLVRASPVMHAQYRSHRDAIIRTCAARDMDGFLVDAYACVMSRVHAMGSPQTREKIIAHLEAYRGWMSDSRIDAAAIQPSYVRWLSAFHLKVVKPLAHQYSAWALQNLFRVTSKAPAQNQETVGAPTVQQQDVALSRSEEIRIFRALYRYETYYHLFGRRNWEQEEEILRLREINSHFFGLFHPWEAEAIGCIDVFVRQRYDQIFDEVQDDLHAANPSINFRDDTQAYTGSPFAYTEREGERSHSLVGANFTHANPTDFMDGTVSRGLRATVDLFQINDRGTLLAKLRKWLRRSHLLDDPIRRTLLATVQAQRRNTALEARDEAEQRKEVMEFAGDAVPANGPPLGWVLLWNGIYVNIYGEHVPSTIQKWGYVMWDERRWNDSRAKALVLKQWVAEPERAKDIEMFYGWKPSGI